MSSRLIVMVCVLVLIGAVLFASPQPVAAATCPDTPMWPGVPGSGEAFAPPDYWEGGQVLGSRARWEPDGMWSDYWRFPAAIGLTDTSHYHLTAHWQSAALDEEGGMHIVFLQAENKPYPEEDVAAPRYVRCGVTGEVELDSLVILDSDARGRHPPTIAVDPDDNLHIAWFDGYKDAQEVWHRTTLYKFVPYDNGEWLWDFSPPNIVVEDFDDFRKYHTSDLVIAVSSCAEPAFVHLAYAGAINEECQDLEDPIARAVVRHSVWAVPNWKQGQQPSPAPTASYLVSPYGCDEPYAWDTYRWLEMAVDCDNVPHFAWVEQVYDSSQGDTRRLLYAAGVTGPIVPVTEFPDVPGYSFYQFLRDAPSISLACDAHNEIHRVWVQGDEDIEHPDKPFRCYYEHTVTVDDQRVWQNPEELLLEGATGTRLLACPSLAATSRDDPTPDFPGETVVDLHVTLLDGSYYGGIYAPESATLVYLQQDGDEARQVGGQNMWSRLTQIPRNGWWPQGYPLPPVWQILASREKNSMKVAMVGTVWNVAGQRAVGYRCFDATSAMSPVMPPESMGSAWHLIGVPLVHHEDCDYGGCDGRVPPELIFDPIPISGNLHRYDRVAKGYVPYYDFNPGPFGHAGPGDGYWLSTFGVYRNRLTYEGILRSETNGSVYDWEDPYTPPYSNYMIWTESSPPGWLMIGTPTMDSIPLASVKMGQCLDPPGCTTWDMKWWEDAVGAGWVAGVLYYYDPITGGYKGCGLDPWRDDDALRPWLGYQAYFYPDWLTMFIPLHRDLFKPES